MRKIYFAASALLAVSLLLGSCILDPKKAPPKPGDTTQEYKQLKEKDDILFNLEKAYNERNINQYDKLLDEKFIFYFSPGDIGEQVPEYWEREAEIRATRNIFSRNPVGKDPVVSIKLTLYYTPNIWVRTSPAPDDTLHRGETWYEKEGVRYDLEVSTAAGTTYQAHDFKASFIIRYAEVNGDSIWRIVQWNDIGDGTAY